MKTWTETMREAIQFLQQRIVASCVSYQTLCDDDIRLTERESAKVEFWEVFESLQNEVHELMGVIPPDSLDTNVYQLEVAWFWFVIGYFCDQVRTTCASGRPRRISKEFRDQVFRAAKLTSYSVYQLALKEMQGAEEVSYAST